VNNYGKPLVKLLTENAKNRAAEKNNQRCGFVKFLSRVLLTERKANH